MASKRGAVMMCLIRCGQTGWGADGRIQGSADLPLGDQGRAAVEEQARHSGMARPSMVYHPPDEAAADTAKLFAARCDARTKSVKELADPHLGLLEGMTEREFAERYPTRHRQWEDDPLALSPPEGEPMAEAADRLFRAIAKILKRNRSGEVAFVLHDIGLGLLRSWLADRPLNEFRGMLEGQQSLERYAVHAEVVDMLEDALSAAQVGH